MYYKTERHQMPRATNDEYSVLRALRGSEQTSVSRVFGEALPASALHDYAGDLASDLNDELNSDDPMRYSEAQVERALAAFIQREAERLFEDLGNRFMDLSPREQRQLLGAPERNVQAERNFRE